MSIDRPTKNLSTKLIIIVIIIIITFVLVAHPPFCRDIMWFKQKTWITFYDASVDAMINVSSMHTRASIITIFFIKFSVSYGTLAMIIKFSKYY